MSLQTGTQLAVLALPLIDPDNLKIVAYEVEGAMLTERPSFLRIDDIREFSSPGMIIDSSDEFVGKSDVIRIKQLQELDFRLIGMAVTDEAGHRLGKVEDYVLDNSSFIIKQLVVKRGLLKSLGDTSLLIDRTQIVEINNRSIIIKSSHKPVLAEEAETPREFVNPFSAPKQIEND
jgi:uncharacterized protein YrrD